MVVRSTGYREETGLNAQDQATADEKNGQFRGAAQSMSRQGQSDRHRSLDLRTVIPHLIVKAGDYFITRTKPCVFAIGTLTVLAIGGLNLITGGDISLSLFYLFPITLVTWRTGKKAGFLVSAMSVGVWVYGDVRQNHFTPATYWNASIHLGFFLILATALSEFSVLLEWVRTDYLTGLANARGFHDFVTKEIYRAQRTGDGFSLAYVDIDDFKAINDSLGHTGGDNVLRLFGKVLRTETRKNDIVARIGGDEFTILLSGAGQHAASVAMEKVDQALRAELARGKWPVTYTIGVATFQESPETVEDALEQADDLMYQAKRNGKNATSHRLIEMRRRDGSNDGR